VPLHCLQSRECVQRSVTNLSQTKVVLV
jgi:hypothetical protein